MKLSNFAAAAFLATPLSAGAAHAQSVAALLGDDTIAIIDVAGKEVAKTTKLSGVTGKLVGINVRPADGMMYGLANDGTVFTIDVAAGSATMKSKLETMVPAGSMITVDFNPVADRLRVIGSDGTNLRANVDDGKVTKDGQLKLDGQLKFANGDMHEGESRKVVAGAYTNSMKGAEETTLFDIDATGALVKQAPPNDGVLSSIGMHGAKSEAIAFDIVAMDGANEGWLMAGDTLYKVDLASSKATMVAKISGVSAPVRDIAALPAMMK